MTPVVDLNEYGEAVSERYARLGAGSESATDTGLYVRFEPGFGLNVHVGSRQAVYRHALTTWRKPDSYRDDELMVLGIGGWERLCELVDVWREREARFVDA